MLPIWRISRRGWKWSATKFGQDVDKTKHSPIEILHDFEQSVTET